MGRSMQRTRGHGTGLISEWSYPKGLAIYSIHHFYNPVVHERQCDELVQKIKKKRKNLPNRLDK